MLIFVGDLFLDYEYIRVEMPLVVLYRWSLYLFQELVHEHFLPHFVETLEIKHAFVNTLQNVLAPENVGDGSLFGDGL